MDFEFSMLDGTSLVLISGAMSNSLDRFRIKKLEGNPLLLTKFGKVSIMTEVEILRAIKEIHRIFKDKPKYYFPVLMQLHRSIKQKNSNLNNKSMNKYLNQNNKESVIVFMGEVLTKIF